MGRPAQPGTSQFLARCGALIPGINGGLIASSVRQYEELIGLTREMIGVFQGHALAEASAHDKRLFYLSCIRRSKELEQSAIEFARKAL